MMNKKEYKRHLNAIAKTIHCISDAHGNEGFIEDLIILRDHYKRLFKAQKEMYYYPTAQPKRYNEMGKEIIKHRKIIMDICRERSIGFKFYSYKDYEFKKFDTPVKLIRRGYVMNTYLGL